MAGECGAGLGVAVGRKLEDSGEACWGLGASRPKAEGFQNLGETKDISNEAGILQ